MGDVHGNTRALHAVLSRMEDVDLIYCLGDIVGIGPDPRGALEMVQDDRRIRAVRGNHDHNTSFFTEFGPLRDIRRRPHHDWVRGELDEDMIRWLGRIPILLTENISGMHISFMHCHPKDIGAAVPFFEKEDPRLLEDFYADVEGDLIFFGHTHRELDRICGCGRRFLNPGPVGAENGGIAPYLIIEEGPPVRVIKGGTEYDLEVVRRELKCRKPPYHGFILEHFYSR